MSLQQFVVARHCPNVNCTTSSIDNHHSLSIFHHLLGERSAKQSENWPLLPPQMKDEHYWDQQHHYTRTFSRCLIVSGGSSGGQLERVPHTSVCLLPGG